MQHRNPHDKSQRYALKKARAWWGARRGGVLPSTVDEALRVASTLWKPSYVDVESGQFASITPQGLVPPAPAAGTAAPPKEHKLRWYGVRGGSKAGVYCSWKSAEAASQGVRGASVRRFATKYEAYCFAKFMD